MTELKTLKDIRVSSSDFTYEELNNINLRLLFKTITLLKEKVRAEAVKWIKEFDKCRDTSFDLLDKFGEAEDFIFKFFNLTEENLK